MKKQPNHDLKNWFKRTLLVGAVPLAIFAANKLFAKSAKPSRLETRVQAVQPAEVNDVNTLQYSIPQPDTPVEPNYANEPNAPEPNVADVNSLEAVADSNSVDVNKLNEPAYATKISQKGLDFIKQVEGFSPKPYPDADGFSIGYGHFILPGENYKIITEEKAEELLKKDAGKAESAIAKYAVVPLTQQQYDTLVSFVYNVGEGRFAKSTLLKKLNEGNYERVSREIERWNKGLVKQDKSYKRVVLGGLVDRRKNERELFDKGDYVKD